MLLFSSALTRHRLTFVRLSEHLDYGPLAAQWAEDEWGYIRNKGIEYREGVMRAISRDVYIGIFAGCPVAMFALLEHEFHERLPRVADRPPHTRQLMYVYVDKDYRGLGFGKQIIEEARRLAASSGANLIVLDTLKPRLNRLYEKYEAKVVCEGTLFSHPTEVLTMKV